MLYKGDFIARIPNDENAKAKIEEYKAIHGQLRLWGRHPKRKQVMAQNGLIQNFMGDLPYRLGSEIVIYRNENGMTFKQFQNLQVGTMIETVRLWSGDFSTKEIGIVLDKKGKNQIKIALGDRAIWTTRQNLILYKYDKR
mgnify:CR=1 FL=1